MNKHHDTIWRAPHSIAKMLAGNGGSERMANNREALRMMKQFGDRLNACRRAKGFETADTFAELIGIEAPRYRRYERGESLPPLDLLRQICVVLEKSGDFLLFGWLEGPPKG